jgi:nitrite reductase/ring-hydroxylating ferredoxin subunit/uncharacterized membrane protein
MSFVYAARMDNITLSTLTDQPALDTLGEPLSRLVRETYEAAGPTGAAAKNAMHGVWLGHPLHPVLTDIPLGAWTTALALDACADDDPGMRRAATFAIGVGLLGAAASAVTGLTDWSETGGQSRREGLLHGLLNVAATVLMTTAYVRRRSDRRANARGLAWAGFGISAAAAYLGGDLVYGRRIGVTHAVTDEPEEFVDVAASADLAEGTMMRARHEDTDVLLVRRDGRVCALAHACAHLGGPLSEGTLNDNSVVCPWHGSEFALDDGRVLNGPATQAQPVFEARERDGRIEVKGAS